jgi:hypothetical protein
MFSAVLSVTYPRGHVTTPMGESRRPATIVSAMIVAVQPEATKAEIKSGEVMKCRTWTSRNMPFAIPSSRSNAQVRTSLSHGWKDAP